jgi:hypothetical protein
MGIAFTITRLEQQHNKAQKNRYNDSFFHCITHYFYQLTIEFNIPKISLFTGSVRKQTAIIYNFDAAKSWAKQMSWRYERN